MLAPVAFAFLTYRECIVGMKPSEAVPMGIDYTETVRPRTSSTGITPGGDVISKSLGYVIWKIRNATLGTQPCVVLSTECFDKTVRALYIEEVWTTAEGTIVRQHEELTKDGQKATADSEFYTDHVDVTRVAANGERSKGRLEMGDIDAVQRRFKPMEGDKKEFQRWDGLAMTFHRVKIERSGRFRGTWGGDKYEGAAYRFTVDGVEQTAMMTAQDEIVQVKLSETVRLVLVGQPKSQRKHG